ncbi:HK97-gp10 family putative phage morphogenesis protein [Streptomyces sp. NPDC005813]|uniref:HK97-gp10 family putative phage morphogenesis protein n=1 Tax=Streptomyces sp. NPDC005813 TaxID=3155592 RepID=UPI0033F1C06E
MGTSRLRGQLDDMRVAIRQAAFEALKEGATAIVADTKQKVARDTGNLQEGVAARYHNTRLLAEIGWWQPDDMYVIFVEHGTSRRPARPVLVPSLEAERAKIGGRLNSKIGAVLPR